MKNFVIQAYDITTKITRWLVVVASVCIGIVMVVNFTDIIGTKFFKMSVPGSLDISEELMVLLTLLPLAFVALERGHIRITLVEERLPSSVRFALQIIQYAIAALITGFITVRAFAYFLKSLEVMTLKAGIDLPIWPATLVVVISFAFLTLVWLLLLAKALVVDREQ